MKKLTRPKPTREKPPHYIREWRKFVGLSQEALGERLNMNKGSISRIETYETNYTQGTLEAVAYALGRNIEPIDLLAPPPSPDRPESELTAFLRKLKRREDQATALRILKAAFEKDGTNG